jgi:hypothetical protein
MPRKTRTLPEDLQAKQIEIVNRCLANAIANTMTQIPDASLQEADAEALERWLDDGGASDNQAAPNARCFSPLQFFRPQGDLL